MAAIAQSNGYPMRGYVFTDEGRHDGGVALRNKRQMEAFMATKATEAMKEGREIRITDCDDYCVFHAKDRRLLFWGVFNPMRDELI